jgi:outer membrane protein W
MKKILTILVVLFALSFTYSQSVSVQAGVDLPMGSFGDFYDMGFGGGVTYVHSLSPELSLTGSVGYHTFSKEFSEPDPAGTIVSKNTFSTIPIMAGVGYALGTGEFVPYIHGAVGLHLMTFDSEETQAGVTASSSTSESKFGFVPSAGFLYYFAPTTALNVNAGYNMIFTEGETTNYLGILAGVMFGF